MGKCCLQASSYIFGRIIIKVAGNQNMHKISDEFEFRPNRITDYGVSCPWGLKISHRLIIGKWCLHASSFIFDRIIIKVAGNQDRHKSSDEFDFRSLVSMAHLNVNRTQVGDRCLLGYLFLQTFSGTWHRRSNQINWKIRKYKSESLCNFGRVDMFIIDILL